MPNDTTSHVLALVRHAVAEDRETWTGNDDALRPLTDAGRAHAQRIADLLIDMTRSDHGLPIVALRSSPALRCKQTLEPLSKRSGVTIDADAALMEGHEIAPPSPRKVGLHVICAHGDNIPWLLQKLRVDWNDRCKKGSIWLLRRDPRGRVIDAAYHATKKKD